MFLALMAAGTMLVNVQTATAEVSLKMVSMMPKKHPIGKSYNGFVTRLNKEFKGQLQIDWRGAPEVIQQFKQPYAVRIGLVIVILKQRERIKLKTMEHRRLQYRKYAA